MNDELGYVLETYQSIISKHIGKEVGVSFFADSESYVDSIEAIKEPMTPYASASESGEVFGCKVVFFQDFSVGRDTILTDCNICKIDGLTFIKIITPFTRDRSYDFILTKANETEKVLKALDERKQKSENIIIDFPVIGLDFSDLKKQTIDFLLDEKLRDFCRTKHIKLKRGIIFEGRPGNGKSLSLRYLKSEAQKAGIEFKQFDNPKEFLEERGEYYRKDKKHIFVFEDFDALLREREDTNNSPNTILGTVLNTLDGIDEVSDVVSIFTTNQVQLFDSAFIRPGRIDRVINFTDPTKEQMHTFLNAYIPEYASFFKDMESELYEKVGKVSYAILKGICDDINIHQFNKGELSKEEVINVVKEKIKGANKGNETKDTKSFIL